MKNISRLYYPEVQGYAKYPIRNMNEVLAIGEVVSDYLLHSHAPLAIAYRKRKQMEMSRASNQPFNSCEHGDDKG